MSLLAGTGRVDISPTKPMFLVGYPHVPRTSTGIHDPLFATALCLKNGAETLIFVAVDILIIDKDTTRRCREAIRAATGAPVDHILVSATHTHSGPVTFEYLSMKSDPLVPGPDAAYMAAFEAAIVSAAVTACRNVVPALLAVTTAQADGVGGNRLSKTGIADPEVGLLCVIRKDSREPLALVMDYAMHPTVLHEDSLLVSSDFPGYTRQHLAERLPSLTVLYHTGAEGNQSPRNHVTGQTFPEAERLGRKLGESVYQAVTHLKSDAFLDNPVLRAAHRSVALPPRRFVSVADAERHLEEAVARFERLKREKAGHGPIRTAECSVFGAEELVTLARAQETGELAAWQRRALPAEVQALRIGDTFWVGLPCEIFVEYALDIKRRASGRTFVIGLANGDAQGYIVTPEADAEGGYEASNSMFTTAAGGILADTAIELIRQLRAGERSRL